MKSVKLSVDNLESISTGVNMDVSAPHLIRKWLNDAGRAHAGRAGLMNSNPYFFLHPTP